MAAGDLKLEGKLESVGVFHRIKGTDKCCDKYWKCINAGYDIGKSFKVLSGKKCCFK